MFARRHGSAHVLARLRQSAKIAKATEAAMLKVRLQRKQRMADGHALASEELRCMLRETQGMALADSEAVR